MHVEDNLMMMTARMMTNKMILMKIVTLTRMMKKILMIFREEAETVAVQETADHRLKVS